MAILTDKFIGQLEGKFGKDNAINMQRPTFNSN